MPSQTLRLERALTIRGRVVGPEGQAVTLPQGQPMYLNAMKGDQWGQNAIVASDGRFEMEGLPPGTVTLNVWAGNEYKPAKVDVQAGAEGVLITLERNTPQPAPTK